MLQSEPAILTTRPMTLAAARAAGVVGIDESHRFELLVLRWRRARRIAYGVLIIGREGATRAQTDLHVLTPEQIGRLRDSSEGDVLHALIADFMAAERAGYYDGPPEQERVLSDVMYAILTAERFEGIAVHLSMRNVAKDTRNGR